MKALVLEEYNHFEYREISTPSPACNEVLVKVGACGICGSDANGMDGSSGRRRPPVIMGHEAAGTIVEVGAKVKRWKPGDRVTFDSTIYCAKCWYCKTGQFNLCDHRRVLGVSCEEYRQQGAFAQYVTVPQHTVYRLPDNLPFDQAALTEPLSVALHAVKWTQPSANDTAVVIGAGIIGLLIIQILRTLHTGRIIAVDIDQNRLQLATSFATHTLTGNEDVAEKVMTITGSRGADVVFEAVGIAETVQTAVRSVRKGGAVTLVGNLAPEADFPLQTTVTREISLHGSCASCGEYPECLEMLARGQIKVKPLISAVAPLSEGAAWFDRLYRKEPGLLKVILTP